MAMVCTIAGGQSLSLILHARGLAHGKGYDRDEWLFPLALC